MTFTVVFYQRRTAGLRRIRQVRVTGAGVLPIEMHREDVNRHCVAPGGWLEVIEMGEGQPAKMSRAIIGHRSNRLTAQRV